MKKTILFCFFLLFILSAFSCQKHPPAKTEDPFHTEESKTVEEITVTTDPLPEGNKGDEVVTDPPISSSAVQEHHHQWLLFSLTEPDCTKDGEKVWSCSCGKTKAEKVQKRSHEFSEGSCEKAAVCKKCGEKGDGGKHLLSGNTCTLCKKKISSPVFVLNTPLEFDEPKESIISKLGTPSEILTEGDINSLVYYENSSCFTVIQTDSVGLWGVFTFDPSAFFQIDGQIVNFLQFSGKPDDQSDAEYCDVDSCRIYAFRDGLGKNDIYALWMRYSECDYDYMLDSRILQDYSVQSRLSYHYVNALRARGGLSPLAWSSAASTASYLCAEKMAKENFFYHDGLYGQRLSEAGVVWRSCGENISQGYVNAFFVNDAYYNCLDHRNNILSTSFTHVGMGYFLKSDALGVIAVMGAQTFYS